MTAEITRDTPVPTDFTPGPHGTMPANLARRHHEAPAAPVRLPSGDKVPMLVTYADVQNVLACPHTSRQVTGPGRPRMVGAGPSVDDVPDVLLNLDGAEHRRQRAILGGAFTAKQAERWREPCRAVADELLADCTEPVVDLVSQFAVPLASQVICQILGVPPGDRQHFHTWTTSFLASSNASAESRFEAFVSLTQYAATLIETHRDQPGQDLVDLLIQARDEDDQLNENELVNVLITLIVAGHETTAMMISRGVYRLLLHPEQYQQLVNDGDLIPAAVEEILRTEGPGSDGLLRLVAADLTLPSGTHIPAGTVVLPNYRAGNFDPHAFPEPYRFDIHRYAHGTKALPHLAFGHGPHYCLGASMARMMLQEALCALIAWAPALRPGIPLESITWTSQAMTHQPMTLPVRSG
ncbi:cytochrome P450 [Nonomuraea ceibae]|uniref:cytochrome P450 n=1 Tax=Nonomuraea ceibae TaxID=1935170 RepID=UPI001C5E001A|nr:cytochrome P450 [Nonomuraea ceibae]